MFVFSAVVNLSDALGIAGRRIMLNTACESGLKVPSANENEYCHFCFSSANLFLLFPFEQYIRPDMLSFIDNFVGVHLSPVNDTNFTLCKRCIDSIEFCIAFRECCRKHHEAVRDTRHFNQVLDHLHSFLNETVLNDVSTPVTAIEAASLNHERTEGSVLEQLQQPSTVAIADQPSTPAVECSRQKRRLEESLGVPASVHPKKLLKQSEERSYGKGIHIRALMRRASGKCRQETINEISPDACLETTMPAVSAEPHESANPSVTTEASQPDEPPLTVAPDIIAEPAVASELAVTSEPAVTSEASVLPEQPVVPELSVTAEPSIIAEPIAATEVSVTGVPSLAALNGNVDTSETIGPIVNTAPSETPKVCKPCFVAIKKLDISLFTRFKVT